MPVCSHFRTVRKSLCPPCPVVSTCHVSEDGQNHANLLSRLTVVQLWINLQQFLSLQAWNLRLMTYNKAINMSVKAYCWGVFWQDKITVKQVPFTAFRQIKQEFDKKKKEIGIYPRGLLAFVAKSAPWLAAAPRPRVVLGAGKHAPTCQHDTNTPAVRFQWQLVFLPLTGWICRSSNNSFSCMCGDRHTRNSARLVLG